MLLGLIFMSMGGPRPTRNSFLIWRRKGLPTVTDLEGRGRFSIQILNLLTSSRFSSVLEHSILLALLTRVLCGIHVLSRRWTKTGDLNNNRFITGLCEVVPRGRFGVETAWGQGF